LVRAGDPLYVGLLGWLVARSTGRPFMVRINANNDRIRMDTGSPIYPRLLRTTAIEKKIERFVLPRADLVVAPNQDNVDFALANGADPTRVAIFRYGNLLAPAHLVDPAARGADEALFRKLGVAPGRYFLCVSRLQEVKFPDDAVRVLAAARNDGRDVKLVLAGEGAMRAGLEALATELGVSDQVVFAGNQPQDALQQLYAHAAVVISPLTGRALSEAALGAAPIVAYDLDWQADLIETGVTGELVRFRDVDALGRAALKLLAEPDYARAMGKAVRERALEMLDPVKLNEHERATYTKLLERPA
jgi:glycosyltransferase involved in cell wall biosynthesis